MGLPAKLLSTDPHDVHSNTEWEDMGGFMNMVQGVGWH